MYTSLHLWTRVFFAAKGRVRSLDVFAVVRFLMKLFSYANIDTINNWSMLDFQLPSEVLVEKECQIRKEICGL